VFVPLPWAADDHQTTNAAALEKSEAGVLLPQDEATPEALKALIQSRLDEPELWQKYADNVKQFAPTQATERMLELILRA
jgi:UDP-N-acetylglucosamine--N-acetylmuramyl-(pentapeptide) pyrophosphoryl-undecaprenol N-acetylglucosamine transferase